MQAFNDLLTERPVGAMGGAGVIPWSSIIRWCEFYEIKKHDVEKFMRYIRALELAQRRKLESKANKNG